MPSSKPFSKHFSTAWVTPMRILLLSNALEMLAVALVLPAYPAITKSLGISLQTRGLMVSLFSLLQFLSSPVLGRGSDVLGRSFMLRISAVASVFCYTLMLFSTDQRTFVVARVLPGFFKCGISVSQAYISVRTQSLFWHQQLQMIFF
jgi:MFS family permease